ncbi:hypothetical protein HMPREF9207_0033, partial [Cutibacterium acnes J165]
MDWCHRGAGDWCGRRGDGLYQVEDASLTTMRSRFT